MLETNELREPLEERVPVACGWCDAPVEPGPTCPECGANYAKAEAIKANGRAPTPPTRSPHASRTDDAGPTRSQAPEGMPSPSSVVVGWVDSDVPVDDPARERLACLIALPTMLLVALGVQITGFLSGMQRIVFGMPIHELGHAVTAWLCGFNAIPTLWVTLTPPDRGYLASMLVLLGLGMVVHYGWRSSNPAWFVAAAGVFGLQVYGTFLLPLEHANMLITLSGDALGMILATLLMALFYVGKDTQIYEGALRWGFAAIGAAAFVNMYAAWWLEDVDLVGYGLVGGTPTDSWKMIHLHGWDWTGLFRVHNVIGLSCLAALTLAYGLGLWQAHRWVRVEPRGE